MFVTRSTQTNTWQAKAYKLKRASRESTTQTLRLIGEARKGINSSLTKYKSGKFERNRGEGENYRNNRGKRIRDKEHGEEIKTGEHVEPREQAI